MVHFLRICTDIDLLVLERRPLGHDGRGASVVL